MFKINMVLRNKTPGAVRYQEVDLDGEEIGPADGAKIGTLYIRKTHFTGKTKIPDEITVEVSS